MEAVFRSMNMQLKNNKDPITQLKLSQRALITIVAYISDYVSYE